MREQEEDLQRQEEAWREDKRIRKSQEEAEEPKKSEMKACRNKEQQVPKYQQDAKSAIEHAKEQECFHTAQKYIEISSDSSSSSSSDDSSETSSDDSSGSGTRQKPTKLVKSSNKSSTFPDKRKSDHEETPLKQPHQDSSNPRQ